MASICPLSSSATTAPLRNPAKPGVKVTLTVQLCPAATKTPTPQPPPSTIAKSSPEAPCVVAIRLAGVAPLGKLSVTGVTALVLPMASEPKSAGPRRLAAEPR